MRWSPAARIVALTTGILALAAGSAGVSLLAAHGMHRAVAAVARDNVPSVRAATELQNALLEQRGLVAAYLLDGGNAAWLEELERRRSRFAHWLAEARAAATTEQERRLVDGIERAYAAYDRRRAEVIALHDRGASAQAGGVLVGEVMGLADEAMRLCDDLGTANLALIADAVAGGERRTLDLTLLVAATVGLAAVLGGALLVLLFRDLLLPLRRLAGEARAAAGAPAAGTRPPAEELREVGRTLRALVTDVAAARAQLDAVHGRLESADRLAALGRLSACIAHEIRNPLAAMRLQLGALRLAAAGAPGLDERCRRLDEEALRLEGMVRNVLDFARVPARQPVPVHLGRELDKTLELLAQRLREKRQRVVRTNGGATPPAQAEPEHVRQVLLNLLANAADASPQGGVIHVVEAVEEGADRRTVVVRIRDEGGGIPAAIRERLFEPFVTTKADGTGLGLCIAAGILARHGGQLVLEETSAGGTTFAVKLPAVEGVAAAAGVAS